MMFAIAVGEIGLQTAALVQSEHLIHYLPAFFHLILATILIAASWVGWSRSLAKQDVKTLFEWAFVVLLLDVMMVVVYFILVKTVDFGDKPPRIDPAHKVAGWHVLIFLLYLAWDVVTKFVMPLSPKETEEEREQSQKRMYPTLVCLVLTGALWLAFLKIKTDYEHWLTADVALLSVVLLFRALKDSWFPTKSRREAHHRKHGLKGFMFRWGWTVVCVIGFIVGTWMTIFKSPLLLPDWIIQEMRRVVP